MKVYLFFRGVSNKELKRVFNLKQYIVYILNILVDNLPRVSFPESEKVAHINYNIINFKHREKC